MKWSVRSRPADDSGPVGRAGASDDADSGTAAGLAIASPELLARHGARLLDPAQAAAVADFPAPRSTVYRARTLLIPADLLADPGFVEAADAALAAVGMALAPVPPRRPRRDEPAALRRLPRVTVLVPAPPAHGQPARPVVLDAWVALQALRAAAGSAARTDPANARTPKDDTPKDDTEPDDTTPDDTAALSAADVRAISLEHLLVGSAIDGAPIWHGGGVAGSPGDPADSTGSYLFSGGDARMPVEVILPAPARRPDPVCADEFGRRPVVAVLDTGVRAHRWLGIRPEPGGGYAPEPGGFVTVSQPIQDIIHAESAAAAAAGDQPRHLIRYPWDRPVAADPLVGELGTDTGHGTFIAGIVRQVAPDARVLAIRVTHSDGVIYEGDLTCALGLLAERVLDAQAGDPAAMIDVVSLSLGYFSETAADAAYSSGLWLIIDLLLSLGVAVLAAAGNYATSRRFYPAAFAERPSAGPLPVISVGALNPNGSTALFSDGGGWVTAWAPGAAMVSTFPDDINASRTPQVETSGGPSGSAAPPRLEREALDPDDYSGGFALWSGTSFAAPLLAAHVARALLAGAGDAAAGLRLDKPGRQAAAERVVAALVSLGWQG